MLLLFVADVNATEYDSYNLSSGDWYSTVFALRQMVLPCNIHW